MDSAPHVDGSESSMVPSSLLDVFVCADLPIIPKSGAKKSSVEAHGKTYYGAALEL
jgi:hypothetical protein